MKLLFVCTGNICRSPTAEAIFRAKASDADLPLSTDSAGTHGYHVGEPPDPRAVQMARQRGIAMEDLRARQVRQADFDDFDLILAMDRGHLKRLQGLCPPGHQSKLCLFLAESGLADEAGLDVPDPYYGAQEGFRTVFDLLEAGCARLLEKYNAL